MYILCFDGLTKGVGVSKMVFYLRLQVFLTSPATAEGVVRKDSALPASPLRNIHLKARAKSKAFHFNVKLLTNNKVHKNN